MSDHLVIDINPERITFDTQILLRLADQQLYFGQDVYIQGLLCFKRPCIIQDGCDISKSEIGAYSVLGSDSIFINSGVGNYCTIGDLCQLGVGQHEMEMVCLSDAMYTAGTFSWYQPLPPEYPRPYHKYGGSIMPPVFVEHDVTIGQQVTVPSQVHIGTGAIIEAGATITKDVEPYTIVAGFNQKVGQRFPDEICSDLLESKWWELDLPRMKAQGLQLPLHDARAFLDCLKNLDPDRKIALNPGRLLLVPHTAFDVKIYPLNNPDFVVPGYS